MNRRNRTLIVVAVAVILASLASFGVFRAIQRIPVREVEVATRHIVVANPGKEQQLPVGTLLTREQVTLAAWPAASPVPGSFSSIDEVVGRGLIAPVMLNEPITESRLAPREAGAGLPPTIPAGMRAMAVRVNDVIGVAGFVLPSSRVDVIVTVGGQNQTQSRVVLSNIQVLTANRVFDQEKSRQGQAIPARVVTLLVTPRDAEVLALASNEGSIILALRNPLDTEPVETNGARMSALMGAPPTPPVRAVVQGRPRMVTPPPPPPAPKPYTVEAIRGARRTETELK
jgi:pilus assembly protein CpaB